MAVKDIMKYTVAPMLLIFFTPAFCQILTHYTFHQTFINPLKAYQEIFEKTFLVHDREIVKVTIITLLWATLSWYIPSKKYTSQPTETGHLPRYPASGLNYFYLSIITMIFCDWANLLDPVRVFNNSCELNAKLQTIGLLFSIYLYIKPYFTISPGSYKRENSEVFNFYYGTELYPRIFGIDVKFITNARYGLGLWLFNIYCAWRVAPTHPALIATTILQLCYIFKFYMWEQGYMSTIDIMEDRAGFYICYGCISVMCSTFSVSSWYIAYNLPNTPVILCILITLIGILAIVLQQLIDDQRKDFRAHIKKYGHEKEQFMIFNKPAKYIRITSVNINGKVTKYDSALLISGFWGLARHFNYFVEWIICICFGLPAGFESSIPYVYFLFILAITLQRIGRDYNKCAKKYGERWTEYCQIVKCKVIPGIF